MTILFAHALQFFKQKSAKNMQFLIKSAVNNLTSHNKDLPSQSCISSMNLEATQVSKQQITDVLCGEKKMLHCCLTAQQRKVYIYMVLSW